MELINYNLFVDFIVPLFDGKTFDHRLVLLRQRMLKQEENSRLQKEDHQERKMTELAVSATEQIQRQVDKSLEPKLEMLLARKVKTNALKAKPIKKDQHYKLKSNPSNTNEQFAKKESQVRDHSVDSESPLTKFAKQNVGVELSIDDSSDNDDIKPSGKSESVPSGKGKFYKRGNCKPAF